MRKLLLAALALVIMTGSGIAQTAAPEGAKVYFIEPADGAVVSGPVTVRFGLSGMGVAPAGVEKAKTGHHHLLIDTKLEDYTAPVPADEPLGNRVGS